MSIYILQGAVEDGLIFALVTIGLFISYKILRIADMTTDGSFVLGAAVSSVFTLSGHPILGCVFAVIAGMCAGVFTAILQTLFTIPSILAGIITMTGLYTINLLVQGDSPNLFYTKNSTVFTLFENFMNNRASNIILALIVVMIFGGMLIWFFGSRMGLSIRATGDNAVMVRSSSINPALTITMGLALANGFTALSGALLSQRNKLSNINMGSGTVVIGLAGLMIGSAIIRGNKISIGVLGALVGTVIYRVILTFAVRNTTDSTYLKFVSALILVVVMSYPTVKNKIGNQVKMYRRQRDENA